MRKKCRWGSLSLSSSGPGPSFVFSPLVLVDATRLSIAECTPLASSLLTIKTRSGSRTGDRTIGGNPGPYRPKRLPRSGTGACRFSHRTPQLSTLHLALTTPILYCQAPCRGPNQGSHHLRTQMPRAPTQVTSQNRHQPCLGKHESGTMKRLLSKVWL